MTTRLESALAELISALREELQPGPDAESRTPDRLLSIDETAAATGLGRTFIYGELAAGRLRSIKAGRRRLIPSRAIRDYVAARDGSPTPGPNGGK